MLYLDQYVLGISRYCLRLVCIYSMLQNKRFTSPAPPKGAARVQLRAGESRCRGNNDGREDTARKYAGDKLKVMWMGSGKDRGKGGTLI